MEEGYILTPHRWVAAVLFLLDLVGLVGLLAWGEWIAARVHLEVFKVLPQLVLIVGLGGLASLVVDDLARGRERRQQTKDGLRDALSDLVTSYNAIKSVRRRLRAEAVRPNARDPSAIVRGKEYAALLKRLNDVQLNIEAHVRLIDGNRDQYPDAQFLIKDLKRAEKHLGRLIGEWEDNLGSFRGDPPQQSLAKLRLLRIFVGDAKKGFRPSIADPIARVFMSLSRAIAKL